MKKTSKKVKKVAAKGAVRKVAKITNYNPTKIEKKWPSFAPAELRKGKQKEYNHLQVEKYWQKKWASSKIYKSKEDSKKPKYYVLDMFPYPSGEGLHVGHPKGYIATDIISRYKRMTGHSILHPMGFDAFGLPAENYALKTKTNPADAMKKAVTRYKKQLGLLGFDYDWSREVNTTNPEYYKWTQWIFLQLLKKGLAYESFEPINWCPSCKTGLANEDVEDGHCERCGTLVEKKPMRQWVLKITDYAERLLSDLDLRDSQGKLLLDWPESIKTLQKNWIGRSEGALIKFKVSSYAKASEDKQTIEVFTTRIDTIFSGTFVIVSPEHPIISKLSQCIENINEVKKFIESVKNKTEAERLNKENKDGIRLNGISVINPATDEEIQVWVSDFVLGDYGTGAVFADAHDKRDFDMAKKYGIPLKVSIKPETGQSVEKIEKLEECFEGEGILINSLQFNGLKSREARPKIISWLAERNLAEPVTKYKLRDWVFSRQRYWGEPIPVIHCENCALINPDGRGIVSVPEKDLPVTLPRVKSYEPTGTGESPLAAITKWVNVKCPVCKGPAKRETNTMPQWAGSSWYYLRYEDPQNKKLLVDSKKEKYWSPVDLYIGGAEHATRHLIYARFWHKFLYDIGAVSTIEPFIKLQHVGLIMGEDGRKMSKRFGNVINPDEIVGTYGADSLRLYEMFMGPFDQQIAWSTSSIVGTRRFIERVWKLKERIGKPVGSEVLVSAVIPAKAGIQDITSDPGSISSTMDSRLRGNDNSVDRILHKAIKKVSDDIEDLHFNTAISSLMIAINDLEKSPTLSRKQYEILLQLLAPFAPHFTEELWSSLGNKKSIHISPWPVYDASLAVDDQVIIMIQVNGKVRGSFLTSANTSKDELEKQAKNVPEVRKWLEGKSIVKVIVVPNKLVSFVIS